MRWQVLLGLLLAGGCSSIPKIRFMDLDGEAPDGSTDMDTGAGEDGAIDAGDSGGNMADGEAGGGCPQMVPVGATTCCGAIPCGNAFCSVMACMDCESKCVVGSLCCPNMGGKATCVLDASCP